jgi:serine/threonine protein phosphatase 1
MTRLPALSQGLPDAVADLVAKIIGGPERPPRLPKGTRIYAIGDVHGCLGLLERALKAVTQHMRQNPGDDVRLVLLGDYIDRGPDSRGVIDLLTRLSATAEIIPLMGNHERALLAFLDNQLPFRSWKAMGGLTTLMSYGAITSPVEPQQEDATLQTAFAECLPPAHLAFLRQLPPYVVIGDFLFAHAGKHRRVPLDDQAPDDFLTIRKAFLNDASLDRHIVVHGHTPVERLDIRRNRINLDTGAFASGRLTLAVIEDGTLLEIQVTGTSIVEVQHNLSALCLLTN